VVWAASNGNGLYGFKADTGAQLFQIGNFGINRFVTLAAAGGQIFVPSADVISVIRSFVLGTGASQSTPAPVPPRPPVAQTPGPAAPGRPPVNQSTPAPPPFGR
jgi:hypothetical protein